MNGTYDSSSLYLYSNGASIGSASKGDHDVDNVSTVISGDGAWDGLIDEVRISSTNRSADWIKFEYRNIAETDNELTWAAEEEAPEVSPLSNLIGNPYMFTGRRFDRETELYYYRARYYNPYIGRFLQTDPIGYGDGINWYNYCGNNSVGRTDPSGLGWVGDYTDPDAIFEVIIVFYDGGDPGGVDSIDGAGWQECADDSFFDFAVDIRKGETRGYWDFGNPGGDWYGTLADYIVRMMTHPEDWARDTEYNLYLLQPGCSQDYSKLVITAVYIFDHGATDTVQIGGRSLIQGSDELASFCSSIGNSSYLAADATINFRGCHIGEADANGDRSFLKELASLTGHTVTGIDGRIQLPAIRWTRIYIPTIGSPDYTFENGLYQATPDGVVTPVWKNEIIWENNGISHVWHNPWGKQPY